MADGLAERFDKAAELEAAIAEVKRGLGVETAEARVIAVRLPSHLETPFWEHCLAEVLGGELALAERATASGWGPPGRIEQLTADLARALEVVKAAEAWADRSGSAAWARGGGHDPENPNVLLVAAVDQWREHQTKEAG